MVAFFVLTRGGHARETQLVDGIYEGEYLFVTVNVTVEEGKISRVKMTHHGGGGEKYAAMVDPLIDRIVKKQSTDVDGITGATVSSDNLRKAVDDALKKAR